MKCLKWVLSVTLMSCSLFIFSYVFAAIEGDLEAVIYDTEILAIISFKILFALLLAAPLTIYFYKSVRESGVKENKAILSSSLAILCFVLYVFAIGKFFGHGTLFDGHHHKHTLVEIMTHVH